MCLIHAHLGDVAKASSIAESRVKAVSAISGATETLRSTVGFVELSLGHEAAALPYLRPLIEWFEAKGVAFVTDLMVHYALEAFVATGELDVARQLTDRYEREAKALESPWALAVAARCRGLLAAAEGDLDSAVREFERARSKQAHGRWPFELARTLLALGRTQRRAKRKAAAKDSLERALAIFERLPAPLWAERAREELARIGLRRAASHELTEAERSVAQLAASGLTNREVASQLYMSPKTVEANLARAYRKLGIRSRAELGAQLAGVGREPAQT
jgi:DNA-binding CsgD family transcriptional regulator